MRERREYLEVKSKVAKMHKEYKISLCDGVQPCCQPWQEKLHNKGNCSGIISARQYLKMCNKHGHLSLQWRRWNWLTQGFGTSFATFIMVVCCFLFLFLFVVGFLICVCFLCLFVCFKHHSPVEGTEVDTDFSKVSQLYLLLLSKEMGKLKLFVVNSDENPKETISCRLIFSNQTADLKCFRTLKYFWVNMIPSHGGDLGFSESNSTAARSQTFIWVWGFWDGSWDSKIHNFKGSQVSIKL